jgi:predicted DNA-binding transcriptional regulator AlpA
MSGDSETKSQNRASSFWPPEALSRKEAAHHVGVGPTTFDSLVEMGEMPRPRRFKSARRVVWLRRELDQYLADLPVDGPGHTDEYDGVSL